MDLKQAKIMSVAVIGIFAVIVAVVAFGGSGGFENHKDEELFCLGLFKSTADTLNNSEYSFRQKNLEVTYELLYDTEISADDEQYEEGKAFVDKTINDYSHDCKIATDGMNRVSKQYEQRYGMSFFEFQLMYGNPPEFQKYLDMSEKNHCAEEQSENNKKINQVRDECSEVVLNMQKRFSKTSKFKKIKAQGGIDVTNPEEINKFRKPKVRWCYATYAPHGDIWSAQCYDYKTECESRLREEVAQYRITNTRSCYEYEEVAGYCIDGVYTGDVRLDDVEGYEYKITTQVCTRTLDECNKFIKYRDTASACSPERVSTREAEYNYLTSDKVKDKILRGAPVDPKKCNIVRYAQNQQQAFEAHGLDWGRTKNWGAFVDVNGILRVDGPSCREIVKDSAEYNKYKIKG